MEGEVTVRDVMTRDYVGVSESDTVLGAVRLMREDGVGSVVVLRGSEPVGIMTESDVLGLVAAEGDPAETPVSEVMSNPVISMHNERALSDAAGTMSRNDIRRILVTDDTEMVGVLTERDVISASASLSGTSSFTDESTPPLGNDTGGEFGNSVSNDGDRAEYTDRSICEACGTLSRGLSNVNGQLICADCREV